MESYIAGGVESVLLDELKFTPSPGASYILNKSQVRYFPSGSSIYSPTSGQRVCKISIAGPSNQWQNPQSSDGGEGIRGAWHEAAWLACDRAVLNLSLPVI